MSESNNDPYEKAKELNCDVILPEKDQIFVDLDDPRDFVRLYQTVDILNELGLSTTIEDIKPSRSKLHFHAYVRIKGMELSNIQRIALQGLMGSDIKREVLALKYLLTGEGSEVTSCFFVPKPDKKEIE